MAAKRILPTDNPLKMLLMYFIGCITIFPCALWACSFRLISANLLDCSSLINHLEVSMLASDTRPSTIGRVTVGSGWARDCRVRNASFLNTELGSLAAWRKVAERSKKTGIWETGGTSIVTQGVQRWRLKRSSRLALSYKDIDTERHGKCYNWEHT